LAYYQG